MRKLRGAVTDGGWPEYVAALGFTAAVTGAIALVRLAADVPNISMLYLLAVLASAVLFGSRPAIVAAVAAFLAFNFFFIHPEFTFTVADEDQWVALGLLLVTGIVTGQLAASLRERARENEQREREATVLYDVVRLMAGPDLGQALMLIAQRLKAELELEAVTIVLPGAPPAEVGAKVGSEEASALIRKAREQPDSIFREGAMPQTAQRGSPGRWIKLVSPPGPAIRPEGRRDGLYKIGVSVSGKAEGHLFLVRNPDKARFTAAENRLLSAVASQLGVAVERARLREESTEAEVLRRTDELRTALLNAVSHDLRTPLSSIMASAGSLLQTDVQWNEEERREFAQAIEQDAQRLDRLVGNLLDLSRIQAGSIRPEKSWYDLGSLIDEATARARAPGRKRLMVDVPEGLPPVEFDYVEIDQVITNLIENAWKHTPAGTKIRVSARISGGEVEVEVVDQGPGISTEVMGRVFDPFYRGRDGAGVLGSGLGLAIAKGLVEAHGGRIWVDNGPEGGARFFFTLPLGEPPVVRVAAPETAA